MARYRLRFLLQEIDLDGRDVVIGRSPSCNLTLDDPLVSRQHAIIVFRGGAPHVADLGSRNGVKVNGRKISAESQLTDGDRIRLGSQEFVVLLAKESHRSFRTTGLVKACSACGFAFNADRTACPECGAPAGDEEEDTTTTSGLVALPPRSWTIDVILEVLGRALAAKQSRKAEQLVSRLRSEIEERLGNPSHLEVPQVDTAASLTLEYGQQVGDTDQLGWTLGIYRTLKRTPPTEIVDKIEELPAATRNPAIEGYLDGFPVETLDDDAVHILGRLRGMLSQGAGTG